MAWQFAVGVGLLAVWELVGRTSVSNWVSRPSLILARLYQMLGGEIYRHLAVTTSEMLTGLAIGCVVGTLLGLWLGYSRVIGTILRPMVVTLYNVPLITLAPLFILWFGFGMESKVVLVAISSFFVIFFNTFSGAQSVDDETLQSLQLMGATSLEQFRKVVFPASMAWTIAGLKIAMPYALVAATTGEMLAARDGLGSLLAKAAATFDMTGIYTVLLVLMAMGSLVGELAMQIERVMLRWRHAEG
ncbi:MAG: ABC transporter permease [Steroidobacterales bacterium]